MLKRIRNRFVQAERIGGLICDVKSKRTQQSFKKESDINNIIAKYKKTGFLVDASVISNRVAFCGDFTSVDDFLSAQNKIARLRANFATLPALIRDKFNNDPANLIDFLSKEENMDEAVKLGLVRFSKDEVARRAKANNDKKETNPPATTAS